MNYLLECKECGATCWNRGDYESDTNVVNLDENEIQEWAGGKFDCDHEDWIIIDSEDYDYD